MYADRVTGSMKRSIDETNRRRETQRQYNEERGITPQTIVKSIEEMMLSTRVADARLERRPAAGQVAEPRASYAEELNLEEWAKILEQEMREASAALDYERAARLRDQLLDVKAKLGTGAGTSSRAGSTS
jgi:excinuclease ABC subunit B